MRYWDGTTWTEHVNNPGAAQPPGPQQPVTDQPASDQPAGYPTYPTYPTYPQQPGGVAPYYGPAMPSTPDGQPLAGWWMRVLATILDGIFQIPVFALFVTPIIVNQWDSIHAWIDLHTVDGTLSYHTGEKLPAVFDFTTGPGLTFYACAFLASALYQLVFLGWKQATLGKLACGLRIRLRETPGLPWSAILPRWGVVTVLGVLSQLPTAGAIFGLALLLDYLWPLWDKNKQALHDKIAKTNVVKKA
jgi:uncharacterized RDD family membrane protein YckC